MSFRREVYNAALAFKRVYTFTAVLSLLAALVALVIASRVDVIILLTGTIGLYLIPRVTAAAAWQTPNPLTVQPYDEIDGGVCATVSSKWADLWTTTTEPRRVLDGRELIRDADWDFIRDTEIEIFRKTQYHGPDRPEGWGMLRCSKCGEHALVHGGTGRCSECDRDDNQHEFKLEETPEYLAAVIKRASAIGARVEKVDGEMRIITDKLPETQSQPCSADIIGQCERSSRGLSCVVCDQQTARNLTGRYTT